MKIKASYTIESKVAQVVAGEARKERRSLSNMVELLIMEALEARGWDTYHIVNREPDQEPKQLKLEGGAE